VAGHKYLRSDEDSGVLHTPTNEYTIRHGAKNTAAPRLFCDFQPAREAVVEIRLEKSRAGEVKRMSNGEMMQAPVHGAQALPEPGWLGAVNRHWIRS
jgi:hypothetical protein